MTEDTEFIFVDDCTPDCSINRLKQVIAEFPHLNVSILRHNVNKGLPTTRKTGLIAAKGDYILHVDSDDWIEPDMIKTLYDTAKTSDADIVICDYFISSSKGERPIAHKIRPERFLEDMLKGKVSWNMWTKMVRRELYKHIEFPIASMAEDAVIMLQLNALTNKRAFVRRPLYHYCQNGNSMSRTLHDYDQLKRRCEQSQQNVTILSRKLKQFGIDDKALNYLRIAIKVELLPITASRLGYIYYRSIYPKLGIITFLRYHVRFKASLLHIIAPLGLYKYIS